jgi:hypothetical protein
MDPEQYRQLAVMMTSGMPSVDAIRYFALDGMDDAALMVFHDTVIRAKALARAVRELQGKSWQDMSLDEKMKWAVEKHYAEMAYFLYSHNYSELSGLEKTKADTCRVSLEQRLAGTSGQMNALDQWFADVRSGKVKLGTAVVAPAGRA